MSKKLKATLMGARMEGDCFAIFVQWGQAGFEILAQPSIFSGRMSPGDKVTIEYEESVNPLTGPYLAIYPAH